MGPPADLKIGILKYEDIQKKLAEDEAAANQRLIQKELELQQKIEADRQLRLKRFAEDDKKLKEREDELKKKEEALFDKKKEHLNNMKLIDQALKAKEEQIKRKKE